MRKFGWKKDPYRKPKGGYHLIVEAIPSVVNMSQWLMPVGDQGNVGSCTGWGISGSISSLAKKLSIDSNIGFPDFFSPTWIYNGERFIEGTLSTDSGANPDDGFSWLNEMGALPDRYWPYNPNTLDTTSPPSGDDPLAAQWSVAAGVRVTGGFSGICSALAAGYFVAFGIPWFDSWMNPGPSGILQNVTVNSSVAGGHEVFLYGYDQTQNVLFGQNSWGASWGKSGLFTMPASAISVFNKLGGYDAMYATINYVPAPIPPPTPTPVPSTQRVLWVQESLDNGNTWQNIFKGNIN
jgi:hypothetical protein